MAGTTNDKYRRRVLLLTPTGRDAALISEALSRNGILAEPCKEARTLPHDIEKGAGAILIAEEALTAESLPILTDALQQQPAWSDLPILILSTTGESTPELTYRLDR